MESSFCSSFSFPLRSFGPLPVISSSSRRQSELTDWRCGLREVAILVGSTAAGMYLPSR
jgi:hypothetical protein